MHILPLVDFARFQGGAREKVWDPATLDLMRCEGDPPADEAVAAMFEATDRSPEETARILLRQLLGGGHYNALLGGPGAELLEQFLREHRKLPPWADPNLIEQAQHLCRNNLVVGSVLLAVASLPECYLDARGAPVLTSTGQLGEQPARRLRHTSHFVFSVCAPGGLVPRPGDDPSAVPVGIEKALTVRLMHALIRRFTIEGYRLPESLYQEVEHELGLDQPLSFGIGDEEERVPVPINQEDQAFVSLTFSYVVVRGLERMGIKLTPQDRDAYVHLWNVVGHVMGLRRELMPDGYEEAASLFHALKQRLAGPSAEGKALTEAMMGWINELVPRPLRSLNLAAEMMTYFIGTESAAMLGIEQRGLRWVRHRAFTFPLELIAAVKPEQVSFDPLAMVVQYLAGPMVKRFVAEVERNRPPPPPEYVERQRQAQAEGRGAAPRPSGNEWPSYVLDSAGRRPLH